MKYTSSYLYLPALFYPLQAGLYARDAVYRAREDRAATKFYANKARDKAERLGKALQDGQQMVAKLLDQAKAVCFALYTLEKQTLT